MAAEQRFIEIEFCTVEVARAGTRSCSARNEKLAHRSFVHPLGTAFLTNLPTFIIIASSIKLYNALPN
jgi:hypothetical protein